MSGILLTGVGLIVAELIVAESGLTLSLLLGCLLTEDPAEQTRLRLARHVHGHLHRRLHRHLPLHLTAEGGGLAGHGHGHTGSGHCLLSVACLGHLHLHLIRADLLCRASLFRSEPARTAHFVEKTLELLLIEAVLRKNRLNLDIDPDSQNCQGQPE